MKKSLGISALLFGAAFALPVFADTYDITLYDGTSTTIDGNGSFTYSAGAFSDFTIVWDTVTFNFLSIANSTPVEDHGCDGGATISVYTFLTTPDCQSGYGSPPEAWAGVISGSGALSISPNYDGIEAFGGSPVSTPSFESGVIAVVDETTAPVPEPNAIVLLSTVLLAVALMGRKRIALR